MDVSMHNDLMVSYQFARDEAAKKLEKTKTRVMQVAFRSQSVQQHNSVSVPGNRTNATSHRDSG